MRTGECDVGILARCFHIFLPNIDFKGRGWDTETGKGDLSPVTSVVVLSEHCVTVYSSGFTAVIRVITEGTPNLDWRGFILYVGVSSGVFDYSTTDRRTLRQGIKPL